MTPPPTNSAQRRPSSAPIKTTPPTPQAVKFESSESSPAPVPCTSHHAGCNGQYHLHHNHTSLPHNVANPDKLAHKNGNTSKSASCTGACPSSPSKGHQSNKAYVNARTTGKCNLMACDIPAHVRKSRNNNSAASESQQCSESIICCNEASMMRFIGCVDCPINYVKEKVLKKIFSYLNHSDLILCRQVQTSWNTLISQDPNFVENTVFAVNIKKTYDHLTDTTVFYDIVNLANLPFRHGRFQYIDYHFYKEPHFFIFENSDNKVYFSSDRCTVFLGSLKTLEFKNSYVLWSTLKGLLSKAKLLDKLKITDCHVSDKSFPNLSTEFDEFAAGNAIFGLRSLEIYETRNLGNILNLLNKLTGYNNQSLSTLKITYYPPLHRDETPTSEDTKWICYDFCRELKTLMSTCSKSLEVLVLDIQHEQTLSLLGFHLGKELEALGDRLNLKEFVLSPELGVWTDKPEQCPQLNVAMTMKGVGINGADEEPEKLMKCTAASLARFLESQYNLKRLGLPCLEYPELYSKCFKSILQRIPSADNLEYLAVPCAGFLPDDFLHRFPNLKSLKVGASCCGDFRSSWNVFRHYNKEQIGSDKESELKIMPAILQSESTIITRNKSLKKKKSVSLVDVSSQEDMDMMKNIEELRLSAIRFPERFSRLAKCLCNLTSLEVNSDQKLPVFGDTDLQDCIKNMKNLKSLVIGCAEKISDFGVTGIPGQCCDLMFRHQRYHLKGVNTNIWTSKKVTGRPLSDLKNLRKLVLMGASSITDIGVAYGLTFKELKYCHLPYSQKVTSWGIERFGENNPCVETLKLTGVNQQMKDAFNNLKANHYRINKGDTLRSEYFEKFQSEFGDNIALILPSPQEVLSSLISCIMKTIYKATTALRGSRSVDVGLSSSRAEM